jgi:hypothetical protein
LLSVAVLSEGAGPGAHHVDRLAGCPAGPWPAAWRPTCSWLC